MPLAPGLAGLALFVFEGKGNEALCPGRPGRTVRHLQHLNAARIIADIGGEESDDLFKNILIYLEDHDDLSRVLTEGIGLKTVGSILRDVANGRMHDRGMPFKHRPDTSLDEFWSEMISFLDGGSRRAILTGLGGRLWDHGSIVHAISDRRIYLFDSYKRKSLKRSRCTTIRADGGPPPCAVSDAHIFSVLAFGSRFTADAKADHAHSQIALDRR